VAAYPSSEDYTYALEKPAGKRHFKSGLGREMLDEVNAGSIIRSTGSKYLHCANGNFAFIYKCQTPGRLLALRCLRSAPPSDLAERCRQITEFRTRQGCKYLAECRYFDDALYVPIGTQGQYYPVIAMEWVEGKTLLAAAEALAKTRNRRALKNLADRWSTMIMEMTAHQVVHGDLQPDNIHVPPGDSSLVLLDYDTLVVPGFTEIKSPGLFSEGYVHPMYSRSGIFRGFDPHMDDFGAIVILLSLRALAQSPEFFGRWTTQNLLLSHHDLEYPDQSNAFDVLEASVDAQVSHLAHALRQECRSACETGQLRFATCARAETSFAFVDVPSSLAPNAPLILTQASPDILGIPSSVERLANLPMTIDSSLPSSTIRQ